MRPHRNPVETLLLGGVCLILLTAGCSRDAGRAKVDQGSPSTLSDTRTTANTPSTADSPAYVGSQRCVSCHQQRHESYLKSHHSRSLTKVDVNAEVTGQTLDHPLSHRSYEVIRRDDKLWHRETILESEQQGDSNNPLVIAEFPIEYVMGSGKFAKGYLVSDGKFLLQSPVAWYTGGPSYGMSPGYDSPYNAGFGRVVTDECMFCHAGMVSYKSANQYLFTIDELAIGCERCHGPGGQHVEHFESIAGGGHSDASTPFRDSIIHPGKLNRLQSESLCGQCHCQGEAEVSVTGKRDWDFRPGDDFARFKMNYDAVAGDDENTRFVGHFPQLHASKCYQGSNTMTCVTCHNPHHHPEDESRHELHRQQCLACHQDEACGVPVGERMERADNRCVACHMPKTRSSIPHTSTTNHRIAVYRDTNQVGIAQDDPPSQATPLKTVQVVPLQEVPEGMPASEVARLRALGTYWLYRKHAGDPKMSQLAQMAGEAMQDIVQSGGGDAELFANLAMLTYMQLQSVPPGPDNEAIVADMWDWAMSFAQESLRREPNPTDSRETALEVAGRYFYRAGQNQQSAAVFGELIQIRRRKEDWAMFGISRAELGDAKGSESALRQSIRINGGDPDLYETLAIVLGPSQPKEADRLNNIVRRIRRARGQ